MQVVGASLAAHAKEIKPIMCGVGPSNTMTCKVPKHIFVPHNAQELWFCCRCGLSTKVSPYKKSIARCYGLVGALRDILVEQLQFVLSHRLFWAKFDCTANGKPSCIVFCMRCGCYAVTKARNLRLPCQGAISTQLQNLKKLQKGMHPVTKEKFGCARKVVFENLRQIWDQ